MRQSLYLLDNFTCDARSDGILKFIHGVNYLLTRLIKMSGWCGRKVWGHFTRRQHKTDISCHHECNLHYLLVGRGPFAKVFDDIYHIYSKLMPRSQDATHARLFNGNTKRNIDQVCGRVRWRYGQYLLMHFIQKSSNRYALHPWPSHLSPHLDHCQG